MDEGTRELEQLRQQVLESVNGLRNRMAAANAMLQELDGTSLTAVQRTVLVGIRDELRLTLALGDRMLATAGFQDQQAPRPAGTRSPSRAGAAGHVLVVDDDPSNRAIMARVLRRFGHHVTPVADGLEAFEVLSMGGIDCVVSDYQMPHLGGGSLYQQVETSMPEVAGRFVFVTGDYTRAETREFLQRTGQPVLGKPYELDDLAAAVAGILSKRHS